MHRPSVYELTFITLLCIVSLFYYIIQSLDEKFDAEATVTRENSANMRVIYEPYNENLRLQNALTHYIYDIDSIDYNHLLLRFELYWSRLPLVVQSKEAKALIKIPNIKKTINTFIAELGVIENILKELKVGDYKKRVLINDILKQQALLLSQLRIDTDLLLRKSNENVIAQKVRLRNSIFYVLVFSSVAISGIFLLFIVQLLKKSKLSLELKKQSKNLQQLADSLDQKVVERTQQLSELNESLTLEIKEREKIEKKIVHQAYHDMLTGLPNRLLILDRLQVAINKAERSKDSVAILFLDLDDFKKVNDSLGHEMGDKLLVEASQRLRSVLRVDDSVGRLGGDEFIIILEQSSNIINVQEITDKILKKLSDVYQIEGRELLVSGSVGISFYPKDGSTPEALLKAADTAMYSAKSAGRNIYSYYTDEINHAMERRLLIEEQLVGSLERKEFEMLFQPKFNFLSGAIESAEALIRWHNKKLGHVSPSEFIPVVEHSSLVDDIGQFALDQSLQFVASMRRNISQNFTIAVNFSPQQFRSKNLANDVDSALKKYQLDGNALEIEITEGVLFKDTLLVSDLFDQFIEQGVRLSMDDFGTGYSSLSYLRQYPFSTLKIDRSFIAELDKDARDKELTNATIAMAHSLNIKVVAEGIETQSQYDYLKKQGCDFGQGFFMSKPLRAKEFLQLF